MQIQETEAELKEKILNLKRSFESLARNCNGFVKISHETVQAYYEEIQILEAKLKQINN